MREVRKAIKKVSKESAEKAMERHVEKMARKGWRLRYEQFGGNAGPMYEVISYFVKS